MALTIPAFTLTGVCANAIPGVFRIMHSSNAFITIIMAILFVIMAILLLFIMAILLPLVAVPPGSPSRGGRRRAGPLF
jgi:hypothetical protein